MCKVGASIRTCQLTVRHLVKLIFSSALSTCLRSNARMQNTSVRMVKGYIRVVVDKCEPLSLKLQLLASRCSRVQEVNIWVHPSMILRA